jgi:hypothetical protein
MVSIERDDLGGTDSGQLIAMSRAGNSAPPGEGDERLRPHAVM